jgi:hypothetical protein
MLLELASVVHADTIGGGNNTGITIKYNCFL